ncbi:alpha/beta fold hydrolase [Sphingomonas sp.]|uniref:alpha/beta fold hydrolase n=1 Tax=Sphingomonas sp. TaxID=28214 RepID=UPI003AFF743F
MTPRNAAGLLAATGASVAGGLALYSSLAALRAERLVPRDGGFVEVDEARLHYVEAGRGPAIVMVHGLAGQLRNFTYALTELLAAEFRVIALDRPGSGYSPLPPAATRTLRGQGALIGHFVEALGLDRPLLVGHSLGGALSLSLALDRPDLLRGLALIAPLTQAIAGVPRVFRPFHHPSALKRRLIAHMLAVPLGTIGQGKARRVIFSPDAVPEDYGTRGGGTLAVRPSAFYAASSEVCVGTGELVGMAARYPDLAVPLGILFGRGDRILSPALHGERTVAAVPGAELTLIDGGHMIPLTAPAAVADWIRRRHAITA